MVHFLKGIFPKIRVDSSKKLPSYIVTVLKGMWNIGGALTLLLVR